MADIIHKLKKSGLLGMSGSCFPAYLKWQQVKSSRAKSKYVICNVAEGEPDVSKDYYILRNYPKQVISGIRLALKTVGAKTAFIYIKKKYYRKLKRKLVRLTHDFPIELFEKPDGYLNGEESALLNIIEGRSAQPRQKPPFPAQKGLYGKPTLIHNIETFYHIDQIQENRYKLNRFYCVSGKANKKGVFELPFDFTVRDILTITGNRPKFDFFVQVGGGASGAIMLPEELNAPVKGLGSIIIYDKKTTNPLSLMRKWAKFFVEENCDKCAPCREGTYRILEIVKKPQLAPKDKTDLNDIFNAMEKTSFCPLGRNATLPFKTAIKKLL